MMRDFRRFWKQHKITGKQNKTYRRIDKTAGIIKDIVLVFRSLTWDHKQRFLVKEKGVIATNKIIKTVIIPGIESDILNQECSINIFDRHSPALVTVFESSFNNYCGNYHKWELYYQCNEK